MWTIPTDEEPETRPPPPRSFTLRAGVRMAKRVLRLPLPVLIPVFVAFIVAALLLAGMGLGWFGGRSSPPGTSTRSTVSAPTVHSTVSFSVNSSKPVASPMFAAVRGDALLVWISLYGQSHVLSVTDSAGDSFHQLEYAGMAYGTTGAFNGLTVWGAIDVAGGPTVSVTTGLTTNCSPCAIHSAVVLVDVTGVSPQAVDQVGAMANSSDLPNQESRAFSCSVEASSPDLVVAGVAARNRDNFSAVGPDVLVNQQATLGTGISDSMTTAVFEAAQGEATGMVWMNGTDNQTSAWVAGAIALHPAPPSGATHATASGTSVPALAPREERPSPD